ncbi:MAG: hypothetical protein DCC66_11830 [Planctomycetota bacterium]|nr:MAG: hypothetical protein DCC66_11830 [Planctomycetota bacterium]
MAGRSTAPVAPSSGGAAHKEAGPLVTPISHPDNATIEARIQRPGDFVGVALRQTSFVWLLML